MHEIPPEDYWQFLLIPLIAGIMLAIVYSSGLSPSCVELRTRFNNNSVMLSKYGCVDRDTPPPVDHRLNRGDDGMSTWNPANPMSPISPVGPMNPGNW